MTYTLSWLLQEALFTLIADDPACQAFFGDRVYDAAPLFGPDAAAEGLYLTLGGEQARDWSTATDRGAEHVVRLDIHAPRQSFGEVKQAAAAVSDAVLEGALAPTRGRVINARFVDAKTAEAADGHLRRIEMRFRLRVEDTA